MHNEVIVMHSAIIFTSFFICPVQEQVHGSHLSDLMVVPIQPEDLLAPIIHCFILGKDGGTIVPVGKF